MTNIFWIMVLVALYKGLDLLEKQNNETRA